MRRFTSLIQFFLVPICTFDHIVEAGKIIQFFTSESLWIELSLFDQICYQLNRNFLLILIQMEIILLYLNDVTDDSLGMREKDAGNGHVEHAI